MNTNSKRLWITAALLVAALSPSLRAGPGADYWTRAQRARAAEPAPAAVSEICPDAKRIDITETKNSWHNERGPAQTKVIGYKFVCDKCGHMISVAKRSGPTGKGPLVVVQQLVPHDCTGVILAKKN